MPLAIRYLGHRCAPDEAIKPWYFAGALTLEPGQVFELTEDWLHLGRSRNMSVRVASNGVARLHAAIRLEPGGKAAILQDAGSTNGTTTSRGPASGIGHPVRLVSGDTFALADRFDFQVVEV